MKKHLSSPGELGPTFYVLPFHLSNLLSSFFHFSSLSSPPHLRKGLSSSSDHRRQVCIWHPSTENGDLGPPLQGEEEGGSNRKMMQSKGSAGFSSYILRYGSSTQTRRAQTDYVAAAPNRRQKLAMWDRKLNAAQKRRQWMLTSF